MQPTRSPQTRTSPSNFDRDLSNARARTIGLWSALVFVIFLVALDVIQTTTIITGNRFGLLDVYVSFFIPPSFVAMLAALHLSVPPSKRIWSLLALLFGSMWVPVSLSAYYLQLATVRYGLSRGKTEDLWLITFSDWHSAAWALDHLGWGLFLGLAASLIAPVFGKTRKGRAARWLFALEGVSMFALAMGYAVPWSIVEQIGAIVGWLIALPAAGIITAWIFRSGSSADLE
jgi:hypothetical protein